MSRRISSPVFIGRTPELDRIRALLDEAASGGGRTLLVGGELGVGKSRFVREAATLPEAAPFRLLAGRCLGSAGSLPFAPFREALRGVTSVSGGDLGAILGPDDELPATAEAGDDDTAEGGRVPSPTERTTSRGESSRVFELALSLVHRLAEAQPLILAIEDLHWGQPSTLELFAFLAQNAGEAPLILVGTFRSDIGRGHRLWPVLAELDRELTVERLDLASLRAAEVGDLVRQLRPDAPAGLVAALAERTSGNPFFVEEMLAANDDATGPLPETLRGALRQRVLGVSEPAQAAIRVAAVAGLQVDERVIGALVERAESELWAPLRELVDANLLVPDEARDRPVYAFRHALVREAIDDDLLPGERIRLHARVAAFLASQPDAAVGGVAGASSDIADHWESGRDLARALPAHLDAARSARRLFAFAEAARHLERSVSLWDRVAPEERPPDERRTTILADAAEAASMVGRQGRAIELVRLALADVDRSSEAVEAARLLERLGHYLWEGGDDKAGQEARAEALELLPPGDSVDRARILAALASALVVGGRNEEARPIAEAALATALATSAEAEEGRARNTLAVIAAAGGDVDGAADELVRARDIAARVGSPYERVRSYVNHAAILGNAGRLAEALAVADEGIAVARDVGLHRAYGRFLVTNAVVAQFALGQWPAAEARAMEALAESSSGVLAAHLNLVSAQLFVAQGAFREADDHLRAAEALATRSEDPSLLATLAATRAELALWTGDPETAWETSVAAVERLGAEPQPAADLAAIAVRAAADRADRARARRQVGDLDRIAADAASIVATYREAAQAEGPARRRAVQAAEAELTRLSGDADPGAFEAAADAYEEAGLPYPATYLRFRQAEAILTRSRVRTDAVRILEPARRSAVRLGARPLVDEIDGLARRARLDLATEPVGEPASPATPSPSASLGLTERELEVLGLIAAGMTNRQIAEVLFISPKTAGAHVSNIIGKLGVSGRVEAATIAERMGLTAKVPAAD